MTWISNFVSLNSTLHSHCVPFGVTVHRYVEGRKWNINRERPIYPPTLARSRSISLLTLFFLCFVLALARPCLPLTKAYRGQYFFRYYRYVFPLLIFVTFPVVWLHSFFIFFSLFLIHTHFPFDSLRIRY